MEIAKVEMEAVEMAGTNAELVFELNELQLSLVGGGTGDVQLG